jgi:hypothetical protein
VAVNIAAKFRKDDRPKDGLNSIQADIVAHPTETRYAIVELRPAYAREDWEDGDAKTPTVRIVHIEPLTGKDADTAHALLQKAFVERQKSEAAATQRSALEREKAEARAAGQGDLFAGADDDEPPADEDEKPAPAPAKRGRGRGNLFSAPDGEA